jgi:hypothetical protein
MKSIIVFFIFLGAMFILMGQNNIEKCLPKIEYRYIPQTFEQEQLDRVPILATYGKLFTHTDPFQESIGYPSVFFNKKESF